MKKFNLIIIALTFLTFFVKANDKINPVNTPDPEPVTVTKLQADIAMYEKIIKNRIAKAEILEKQSKALNIEEKAALELQNEANRLRMVTLKYKAAIACRQQILDDYHE